MHQAVKDQRGPKLCLAHAACPRRPSSEGRSSRQSPMLSGLKSISSPGMLGQRPRQASPLVCYCSLFGCSLEMGVEPIRMIAVVVAEIVDDQREFGCIGR